MATANLVVDMKSEVKCGGFSGKHEDWPVWSVKFEAYTELVGLGSHIAIAASHVGVMTLSTLGQTANDIARALYALLISKCDGKVHWLVVRRQGALTGVAWREAQRVGGLAAIEGRVGGEDRQVCCHA